MDLIKIIDSQFPHGKSFGTGSIMIGPTNFKWYRGTENVSEVIFFTESGMHKVDEYPNNTKIGIILEPRITSYGIYPSIFQEEFYKKFNIILTHDKDLLKLDSSIFKFYPFGGCWLFPEDQIIHQKSKNISIISSDKNHAPGHILRHEIINKYRNQINGIYGRGYNFIENKISGLKDYRFSLIIENVRNFVFTEKLIDCFMTGTIPIYWGCSNIKDFFNTEGMFIFNKIEELEEILKDCNENTYNKKMQYILENFEFAKKYTIPEDYIWDTYLKSK